MGAGMTDYASVEDLTSDTAEAHGEDFTLTSGKVVRLRGLTREEHLWIGKGTEDPGEIEARMLSKAMIQPPMTLAQVKAWQKSGLSSTVSEISDRIQGLSGFGKGADKSDLRTDGDES
jgi:hypothetical protein